jgi:hypothetical protein
MYVVSMVALAIGCVLTRKTDKTEYKKLLFTLVIFASGAFVFLAISKIFFGDLVSSVFDAVIHANKLIQDTTSEVLNYSNMSSLLPPLIEFVGLAGIGFLLIRVTKNKENRFAGIFVITWVLITWALSRSSIFVLPQRIFREISLPLSIASGIFIADMAHILHSRRQKIAFFSMFAYLVVINSSQVFVSPFLLPEGLSGQVWYKDVDQEKFEYIKENIPVGPVIITNHSNTILQYKLIKEGYKLSYFSETGEGLDTDKQKAQLVQDKITKSRASYLFIGALPEGVNPDVYFTQFANYDDATDILETYKYDKNDLMRQFSDGSKLIRVNFNLPEK